MADRDGGGNSGWLGFIAGIALLAVIALGVIAYTGGFNRQQETAQLDVPDIHVDAPDVNLPSPPPAPSMPPAATPDGGSSEPAPATTP